MDKHAALKQDNGCSNSSENELILPKTRITINFNIHYDNCMAVKKAISIRKAELMEQSVINCEDDQKKLFSLIHSLFGSKISQCCQNMLALLLWHLQSTCFLLRKFRTSKWNFLFWKRVYQRIRFLI